MRFYAVIDTNVLVSALLAKRADSPTVEIVAKLFDGSVTPIFQQGNSRRVFRSPASRQIRFFRFDG